MRVFGLIGKSLTHSFSKKYFTQKFQKESISNVAYELFEIDTIQKLPRLIESQRPNLRGLNVTIPYKKEVIPYLDRLDASAQKVGAVNVIRIQDDTCVGYNSDYFGFHNSLVNWMSSSAKALILGTGGAADAVKAVLQDLSIEYKSVSRTDGVNKITYEDLKNNPDLVTRHQLIINTTPLGMFPQTDSKPEIPYHLIGDQHYLYDLIYNPEKTAFLIEGQGNGARVKNGLEMLELQAEKSWEIWNMD